MIYPDYFTAEDIAEFEYEYELYLGFMAQADFAEVNAECQAVAQAQREDEYGIDFAVV
jgi:hypothetical protein